MSNTLKGVICAIVAAVSYGTIPLGALCLYEQGVNTDSILFYRYLLALIILCGVMFVKKEGFKVTKKEFLTVMSLGAFFMLSSITLFIDALSTASILEIKSFSVAMHIFMCYIKILRIKC